MCPPAQPPSSPAEIGFYWSDEQIFLFLDEYKLGLCLPSYVLANSSPYLYRPSDLPEGIWYLIHLNEKKESTFGFWKAKGEACMIYSNSVINGWRTTLEYYEVQEPHSRRTDWLMQEYTITQKELLCEKNSLKQSTSLCRVFLCNESQTHTEVCKNITGSKDISLRASIMPKVHNTSKQDSRSESEAKSSPQEIADLECFLKGDYLELNDLEDYESHSSSSQNSSCPSNLSDEYFDSLALLRELEEEHMWGQHSSSKCSITTSVRQNDVIMVPPSLGLITNRAPSPCADKPMSNKRMLEHSTRRDTSQTRNESTSNFCDANTQAISNEEKKAAGTSGKKIRLKHYFCFALF